MTLLKNRIKEVLEKIYSGAEGGHFGTKKKSLRKVANCISSNLVSTLLQKTCVLPVIWKTRTPSIL